MAGVRVGSSRGQGVLWAGLLDLRVTRGEAENEGPLRGGGSTVCTCCGLTAGFKGVWPLSVGF